MSEDRLQAPELRGTAGDAWLAQLEQSVGEDGYVSRLGKRHWAAFSDRDTTLLVTFGCQEAGTIPVGQRLAETRGWSHLSLIAEGETFFRDPLVWRYIDRLVDDAFFEDFDRVVFYGAGCGAHAACAFSVAAPGSTVLAVQPVATLAPRVAGWDYRHRAARRSDFTSRYGFAPAMIEGASRAFIVFDPAERLDAMHAALFARPWVDFLRMPYLGGDLERTLGRLGMLDGLIDRAMDGRLTPLAFARMLRSRRTYGPYLTRMMKIARDSGHPQREAMICRSVLARVQAPAFEARLRQIEATLPRVVVAA